MSGGSFNYLYSKDVLDLIADIENIKRMGEALEKLGYANDVAAQTYILYDCFKHFIVRAEQKTGHLSSVWKAMEWWKSCDISESDFKDVLVKYREGICHAHSK